MQLNAQLYEHGHRFVFTASEAGDEDRLEALAGEAHEHLGDRLIDHHGRDMRLAFVVSTKGELVVELIPVSAAV